MCLSFFKCVVTIIVTSLGLIMIKCLESLNFPIENGRKNTALIACVGLGAAYGAARVFCKWRNNQILLAKYKKRREKEQAYIQQLLDELQDEDEEERNKILSMSAEELIAAAQEGRIKPVQIVKSYIYKAGKSTQRTNSITSMIPSAINDAKHLEKIKNPSAYPLYGLPVSIKETNAVKGLDSTFGSSIWFDKPWSFDCVMVAVLKSQGAIPFAKTNLPQTMYSYGSSNPIYGVTHHPQNLKFGPGGSSSGEAALVGDGASILGFGSDIGGSVRVPAHLCGIAGLKPSPRLISLVGSNAPEIGVTNLRICNGPMAKKVDTLALAMRGLMCPLMNELDPYILPMAFNEEVYSSTKPLKIGYYTDDGHNQAIPAVQRAVLKAKMALEKAGHTLVPFKIPRIEDANRIFCSIIVGDGLNAHWNTIKDDPVDEYIKKLVAPRNLPPVLKQIKRFYLNWKWPRIGREFNILSRGDIGVEELWKLEHEAIFYKADFFAAWETDIGSLDAIISPPFPLVACPKEYFGNALEKISYASLYVLLDCPAGVVPVTKTTQADCDALKDCQGHYGDPWDKKRQYACKDSVGMPVGVQCATKPMKDELCLRVMKEIESVVNYEF